MPAGVDLGGDGRGRELEFAIFPPRGGCCARYVVAMESSTARLEATMVSI